MGTEAATEVEMLNIGDAAEVVEARTLEQVEESIKLLNEVNKQQEERITNLLNRTLQITNFYFAFQGVIFSATISSSGKIRCEMRWIPCALSVLVSIFNLVAIYRSISMLLRYYRELDYNNAHLDHERKVRDHIQRRNSQGVAAPQPQAQPDETKSSLRFYTIHCPAVLLLLAFAVVMSFSCLQVECHTKVT